MWVALLRAVNLGSRNTVPMASGNVVFAQARPSVAALERLIADEFGVTTTVILRSAAQVRKPAAAKPPFDETTDVAFTAGTPSRSHRLDGARRGRPRLRAGR